MCVDLVDRFVLFQRIHFLLKKILFCQVKSTRNVSDISSITYEAELKLIRSQFVPLRFSNVFRGVEKGYIGNEWVN